MNTLRAIFILLACSSQFCSPMNGMARDDPRLPGGNLTRYVRGDLGRVQATIFPDGKTEVWRVATVWLAR